MIHWINRPTNGGRTAQVCRGYGINQGTFYSEPFTAPPVRAEGRTKSKYGGMEPSDAKRLRQLEDENARLKKLVA